jgi:hypothetical protein
MRLGVLLLAATVVACACATTAATSRRAEAAEVTADAFKARLLQNMAVVSKAATTLGAVAKRKPPRGMTADQRKAYDEQTRWLTSTSGRFASMKTRMETALAKTKASPAEYAALSMEFVTLRDGAEAESQRFEPLAPACRDRHGATIGVLRG